MAITPKTWLVRVAAFVTLCVSGAYAQGFDESSFDNPAGAAAVPGSAPATTGGSDVVGFGESSFEDSGFAPDGGSVLPSPGGAPDPGPEIVGPAPSDGFGESSFDDGGASIASPNPAETGPSPSTGNAEPPATAESQLPGATPSGPRVDPQITTVETRDFGVPPQSTLRQGQFHGPTPLSIPGASLVTTASLVEAINGGMQMVMIDVLGADYSIPGAFSAQGLAAPGNFQDRTQQQAAVWLAQITGGNRGIPIVVFCSDPMCWFSYNGALRAVNAGYTNVYWYRGGLQAWQMAGLPLHPAGF